MEISAIPEEVRAFLRESIETYEQLEVLLLLHRRQKETWTVDAIANALRVSPTLAGDALDYLVRERLVAVRDENRLKLYSFAPENPTLGATISELVRVYDEDRLGIVMLMNTNAIDRVRTKAIHTFADAFIVGRKKDG